MLILKLLLIPGFLLLISLAGKRWGPSVAGWLSGLPVVVGPILFFLAVEQGEAFAAQSATAALSAMFAMIAFCICYAQVAQRAGWPWALTVSLLVWATAAWVLSLIPASLVISVIAAATALLAAPYLFPAVQPVVSGPAPKSDKLLLRMIAGALLTLAVGIGAFTGQMNWPTLGLPAGFDDWRRWGRLLVWFTWPAWPLVLWTLWGWRRQLLSPHVALPLWTVLVSVVNSAINADFDRALLLALPAMAALAAFALPTLRRSVSALIDWFTLIFFTICALAIWVIWLAMQTGMPAKPAANVARLAPGFVPEFSLLLFLAGLLATVAWVWLVVWRVGRNRQAIWKSLVLPAAGATLCWLLLMSLWLPLLDFARSYGPVSRSIARLVPTGSCVLVDGLSQAQIAALQYQGGLQLVRSTEDSSRPARCRSMVVAPESQPTLDQRVQLTHWAFRASVSRLNDRKERLLVYRRVAD